MNNLVKDIYNIKEIVQGLDYSMYIQFNKTYIPDITGWIFEANILSADETSILTAFNIATDIADNSITLSLSEVTTATLPISKGGLHWELVVTDGSGAKNRWVFGNVTVAYRK